MPDASSRRLLCLRRVMLIAVASSLRLPQLSSADQKQAAPWPFDSAGSGKCEPLRIPTCKQLGHYNQTIYPNLLDHRTQIDAKLELQQYTPLIQVGCHPDLTHFLCVLYAPVCTILQTVIPPCRSLCEDVRGGCSSILEKYGFTWPDALDCTKFPKSTVNSLCVALPTKTTPTTAETTTTAKTSTDGGRFFEGKISSEFSLDCGRRATVLIRKVRQAGQKCLTKAAKQHIIKSCDNKSRCRVQLVPLLTPKCRVSTAALLKIKYTCKKSAVPRTNAKQLKVSAGRHAALKCKGRRELRIVNAQFGDGIACDTAGVFCRISRRCNGNKTCSVQADPHAFASACASSRTTLVVQYACTKRTNEGSPSSVAALSGSRVSTIACASSSPRHIIRVVAVDYEGEARSFGRSDCIYCVVFALCQDKTSCVVPDLTLFKSQCGGSHGNRLNQVKVKYQCVLPAP